MNLLDSVCLGVVQGITEFLPVSSTAHTALCEKIFSFHAFGKSFNVLLNIGTLLALMVFYYKDSLKLIFGGFNFICNSKTENRDFFLIILLSNLPLIIVFGFLEFMDIDISSTKITAVNLVIFAIVLYLCDRTPETKSEFTLKDGMLVGIAQLLSFMPGVSRLGICLSMSRYLGYNRRESFKFSLILSIIPVMGACLLKLLKMFLKTGVEFFWLEAISGIFAAFVMGMVSISVIDSFFKKHTFLIFVVYRIAFGVFVLFL